MTRLRDTASDGRDGGGATLDDRDRRLGATHRRSRPFDNLGQGACGKDRKSSGGVACILLRAEVFLVGVGGFSVDVVVLIKLIVFFMWMVCGVFLMILLAFSVDGSSLSARARSWFARVIPFTQASLLCGPEAPVEGDGDDRRLLCNDFPVENG